MYKHIYELSPFSYPNVMSGVVGNTGALSCYDSFQQIYVPTIIPTTQFLSYCIPSGDSSFYAIDENYAGSSLYEFENIDSTIKPLRKTYNKEILGGVFILQHDSFLFVPGFQSNNLWVINESSFTTVNTVETGPNPHGIFFNQDIFYVPCRGDINNNNANFIYRYKNNDLSNPLDKIDLRFIKDNTGPRHLAFIGDFMYVVTEFSCQIIRLDLHNLSDYKTTTMISPVTPDTTGAEIVSQKSSIYTTLRIKNQPGHFIRYDTNLNETGRLKVGVNPRFFNLIEQDYAIILNQDDQSFTVIDINDFKIVSTITNLQISPQCFVF